MSRSRYLLSMPERAIRAAAAFVGGTVHESAQVLLPRLVRRSRFYEVSAKNLLRILVEGVGAVEPSRQAEPQAAPPKELAMRKGAGNVVELGSFLAFGFSPLWLLAGASDVTRGSRVYLRELVEELKAAGVVAQGADIGSVDELLGVLEGTSGRTAMLIDLPPLEIEELKTSLRELRDGAADLPKPEELARVYASLRKEAAQERGSILEVSSGVGLAFLLSARNVSRTHLVTPYQEDWRPMRDEGFIAYARRVGRPYARAVTSHFHPERATYTQRFLGRNDPGSTARFCDEFDGSFGWEMHERLKRASHAVALEGKVWIFDPVGWEPALERISELGEPAGVVQLLDRHERDSAAVAARFGIPHHVVPDELPDSGIELVQIVGSRFWKECAAWIPSLETLVCADALGTIAYFRTPDEPVGVHPLLRLRPPRVLRSYAPQHILCGHGRGVHGPEAAPALQEALRTSRRRLPKALVNSVRRR